MGIEDSLWDRQPLLWEENAVLAADEHIVVVLRVRAAR
jgi:hypothetical protein